MSEEPEYDIVVIGGGATGCGVAVDAVGRGKLCFPLIIDLYECILSSLS